VKVLSDILLAIDAGDLAALVLLDLSAAFDTVDHAVLLRRLETFGLGGTALHWFESYLVGRRQRIRTPVTFSFPTVIECGVPQGSVLGPILFLLYIADLQLLIEDRGLCPHHFADDVQIYGFCSPTPSSCTELQSRISKCIDVVSSWMRSHRLQLNTAKTEVIWLTTGCRIHQLPQQPVRVGSDLITPVLVVRVLGIYLDADVSMRSHVMRTTSTCFAVLRQLRGIRCSIPRTVFQSLVSCLVLPRLDYCNSILAGISLHLVRRLQSVMNAAARLVFSSSKFDRITPHLRQLHWLTISWRIDFKLAVLVYKCLHGLAPSYLTDDELHHPAESEFRRRLRSASSHELSVPRTRLSTYGDRAFPVAAVLIWNSLPQHVTSAPSLPIFCTRLKTYFFELCYS